MSEVFVFNASPIAFAPSPPMLFPMFSNENSCVVMHVKSFPVYDKSSLVSVVFAFNASAIAATPFGPKLFYKIGIH